MESTVNRIGEYIIYEDKANEKFKAQIDSISIGNNISNEKARYSKLVFLANWICKTPEKIATALTVIGMLLYGSEHPEKAPDTLFLCEAYKELNMQEADLNLAKGFSDEQYNTFLRLKAFIRKVGEVDLNKHLVKVS